MSNQKQESAGNASKQTENTFSQPNTYVITWLITMGSGGIRRGCSLEGISANFIRLQSKICHNPKIKKTFL